jgi:hypothetical protein
MIARRRTVAVDFDGVIHKHISKWTVAEEIHDGPVDGALDFLERVLEEFDVVIFSARAADPAGEDAIDAWLVKHWIESGRHLKTLLGKITVTSKKPHAFIYIDDRGWHFEGKFPTMEELRSFESWTKKQRKSFAEAGLTVSRVEYSSATVNSDYGFIVEAPAGFELVINGTIVASRARVEKGDTVTLRKQPAEGSL